jgi:hypothetical protein
LDIRILKYSFFSIAEFGFIPENEQEKQMEQYAIKLMDLRKQIEDEMKPFL